MSGHTRAPFRVRPRIPTWVGLAALDAALIAAIAAVFVALLR